VLCVSRIAGAGLPDLILACGGLLGSDADIEEIRAWKQKIEALLSCHAIFMADERTMVLFVLRNEENQVQWRTLEGEQMKSLWPSRTGTANDEL
jgi:hypothetical protein